MSTERDYFQEWLKDTYYAMISSRFLYSDKTSAWYKIEGGVAEDWQARLFFFGKTPKQAAAIIQRAYKLYIEQ